VVVQQAPANPREGERQDGPRRDCEKEEPWNRTVLSRRRRVERFMASGSCIVPADAPAVSPMGLATLSIWTKDSRHLAGCGLEAGIPPVRLARGRRGIAVQTLTFAPVTRARGAS
jgi:hypothetical protein